MKTNRVGLIGLFLTLPFMVLLITLGQVITAFWVTPEIIRWWRPVEQTVAYVGSSLILIVYLLVAGSSITRFYFRRLSGRGLPSKKRYGGLAGLALALPVLVFYVLTHLNAREKEWLGLALAGIGLLYLGWGVALHLAYRTFYASHLAGDASDTAAVDETRRRFVYQVAATSTVSALTFLGVEQLLIRERQRELAQFTAVNLPKTLTARVFPMTAGSPFPEMRYNRYHPDQRPIGVCFPGGGFRAYSAALGQMRALHYLGLLDRIGCISCVSGGALMGALFSYAPETISDEVLLGPVLAPAELTLAVLGQIGPQNMAAPLLNLTDKNFTRVGIEEEELMMLTGHIDPDKLYARVLNELFLKPFGLNRTNKFFSLDDRSVKEILLRNPGLTADDFYTMRFNRPYFIAGINHAYPIGADLTLRNFEATPLYTGTRQLFAGEGIGGKDFGGGYIESFAFDSKQGAVPDANNLVTVPTPDLPFLLSDMIGSSSAAPGAILDKLGQADMMPSFYYWPLNQAGAGVADEYSFIDGGILENLGIVPLLQRQYPVIVVFVNSAFPIGLEGTDPFARLDFSVGQVFGFVPTAGTYSSQETQIFPQEQFWALADGLGAAKQNGRLPVFVDQYPIVQPNNFGIPPYPGDGKVTVVWFYNDVYQPWFEALPEETKQAMQDPAYNLAIFPHYKTLFPNTNASGVPELFYLSPEQINLLSYMWTYALMDEGADLLQGL